MLLSLFVNSLRRFNGFHLAFFQGLCEVIEGSRHLAELAILIGQRGSGAQISLGDSVGGGDDVADAAQDDNIGAEPGQTENDGGNDAEGD